MVIKITGNSIIAPFWEVVGSQQDNIWFCSVKNKEELLKLRKDYPTYRFDYENDNTLSRKIMKLLLSTESYKNSRYNGPSK